MGHYFTLLYEMFLVRNNMFTPWGGNAGNNSTLVPLFIVQEDYMPWADF